MEVVAELYRWTATGMRPTSDIDFGWIKAREVERLLEQAHAAGRRQGIEETGTNAAPSTPWPGASPNKRNSDLDDEGDFR